MVQTTNQNIQQFFTYWKDKSIPNVKKQNRQTDDVINFGEFSSLSLESPSVVTSILYVCYLYEEHKADAKMNELQYRMFSRKALSGDSLPQTLDTLVLYLRRNINMEIGLCTSIKPAHTHRKWENVRGINGDLLNSRRYY